MPNSVPRPEYPRPQFTRPRWLNLNGEWEFERDPGRSGFERGLPAADRLAQQIIVPFCMESELSGIGYKDFCQAVWYRKTLDIPHGWAGQRILLHVGACDFETHVFLNGQKVGVHHGGYVSFTMELTPYLKNGENILTLGVLDDTRSPSQARGKQSEQFHSHGCDYTRTTGVWQTVWLEPVPTTHLQGVKLTPQREAASLLVEARVNGPQNGLLRLRATASANGQTVGEATVPVCGTTAVALVSLSDARDWSVEDPFLYDLNLALLDASGNELDTVESYFGLRSLDWTQGPAVLLNGKPVYQRLILDQGFYPDGIYTASSDDELKADITRSQAMGFNGARLHQKVFEPRFLHHANQLGYLVWGEMGSWGLGLRDWRGASLFTQEWTEIMQRDFNNPALVGWCPLNETNADNPDLHRALYRLTKAYDATRPCIDTSGYVHEETDLYDVHDYNQDPKTFGERYDAFAQGAEPFRNNPHHDAKYLGQPYWVSEYGGIWWNPGQSETNAWGYGGVEGRPRSEAEFIARYKGLTDVLLRNPKMCAFCYTQLTDVEQEVNGLYTYDRKPKFDPDAIKEINQQKAAIEK